MSTGIAVPDCRSGPVFPVSIQAGSRIAIRSQSTSATDTVRACVYLFDNAAMGRSGGLIDSIGFVGGSTQGTTVDPGVSANTKGSYAQITASTAVDYAGFCFHLDPLNVSFASTNYLLIDIAVGAGGSEKIIIPNYFAQNAVSGVTRPSFSPWFDMPIIAGTRIAVRAQCSSATSTLRQFGFVFYGLR
jgi:hypothetical protein